ncbi:MULTISPECIES: marine proteobacterial sortase target protein [unclassified Bradyrhizobium]|jgi:Ca-activated chloride channel family protein|uniref:marine proteobacterial sortase target protein n=1 Tax=Bradyrhizobium TaxID=374 RepID=UPI001FF84FC4|nr:MULTISPECIES: marine proteobacterial sortase target protein [unclassified Bradyrhizobium]MCK1305476.1 marine proteobacterial sortase target protein [Bradyrhizobium sp. 45]MCK1417013.1 marine proteobacterial sortase target protein [Bradyrhizobium sp. CW4]MCK1454927.1 marine proteobacterial sortase target protein [Bradyrhizobium sp. 35]MCK1603218.1 marine proteobacterial sortase target protein [Bradyrhizobium sp. 166]MCK1611802.1 marine proteobacterial sortase target protein [Bradyrhizobium s
MDTFDTTDSNEHPWLGRLIVVGLFLLAQGIAVMLVAFVALLVSFEPGWSATTEQASLLQPGDAKSGSLLLKEDGAYTEAIRLGIDVDITVSGPTLRARVTQIFRNPTKDWVEATYVYPLPADGAVDSLKMVVGNRVIVGDIKERQQARMIYEEARRAGQKAALTEQERPNIFTNSVANIGPGETVLVQIEYQEPVHQSGNEYSLRLPLVVGPRYNPAPIVQSVDFRNDGSGWGATNSDPVPDRDRISPPVLDPARNAPVNPTSITVRLNAGFALGEVTSPHHNVKVASPDNTMRIVSLADGAVAADRDFELTWKPAAVKAPSVGLFRERVGDADYLLAFVTPPAAEQATQKPRPREVIFVIDNSGSMGGTSIVQAKASLTYALSRLQPTDRFNVIRFDDTMDVLFPVSVAADAERVGEATSFVSALQARGGTEMVPAMRAALTDKLGDAGMVRQVVFLTDGAIGNEQQLFETITAMRGRSRVFMVGIGSAPNTYLMTRAAELGRGAFTHIGSVEQVEERMRGLFAKLENPAVTGLSVKFSEAKADVTPTIIPDVYRDEPLVLAAKLDTLAGSVEIKGRVGDRPWSVTLPLQNTAEGNGLSKLWAKRKIADAEVARTLREMTPEDSDKAILALALDHQIVTRLTSLVAVDKTPSRPEGEPLKPSELPINLPAGWDFAKVFGERQQVPAQLRERHADARNQPATRRPTPAAPDAIRLPKTATSAELKMTAGLILVVLALILFVFKRRQSLLTDAA